MHDGQNVFDDSTSYAGEWGIDEILDQIHSEGAAVPIVVAVDHGGDMRMRELGPWTHEEFGESVGADYADFMVNTVKPYIDEHYRTLSAPKSTAIMGSSMGGLMSHYLISTYPNVYAKAGVFSPSFWFSEKAFQLLENAPLPKQHRVYFVVGTGEGKGMVEPAQAMFNLHTSQQHPTENVFINVVPGGQHNEGFWHQHALNAITWLFNETDYEETE
jgi:predicted alpha/beta superfamily hydrolase